MNDLDLTIFLLISKTQSISDAANALFMSQSVISTRLMALEQELDVVLFNRGQGHRKTVLTSYGERFVPLAENILALRSEALRIRDDATSSIRISAVNSTSASFLSDFFLMFIEKYPNIKLDIQNHSSSSAHDLLKNKEIDVAFVNTESPFAGVQNEEVFREDFVVMRYTDHPEARAVAPSELDVAHEIFEDFSSVYYQWHCKYFDLRKCKVRVNTPLLIPALMKSEGDWCILPLSTARHIKLSNDGFQIHPLIDPPPARICYVEYLNSGFESSKDINQLLIELREFIKQHVGPA